MQQTNVYDKKGHRTIRLAAVVAAFAALAAFLVLPRRADIFAYLPENAIAYGYHGDLRATWKDQLKNPAIASLLAGWDESAEKACRQSGAFWTFLLAVGEDAASALLRDDDGRFCAAAASPMGKRHALLKFFWIVRWVPGLGRIHVSPEGIRYIDLTDDDEDDEGESAMPLILSVALGRDVLLAKLSDRPVYMGDMLDAAERGNGSALAAKLTDNLPDGFRHRIVAMPSEIAGPAFSFAIDREIAIDFSQPGGRTEIAASFPLLDGDRILRELLAEKLNGANSTASALAASHAFLLALLPSRFAAEQANAFIHSGKDATSGEDSAIYLTAAPYGAQLFLFAIPALTVSIPGISLDKTMLEPVLKALPKQMRKTCAIHGKDTFCSSATSLRQQMHAAPPPPCTWQNGFQIFAKEEPSAFLHLDIDVLSAELRQIAQAIAMAASFSRGSVDPSVLGIASTATAVLPRLPTGLRLSAALKGGSGRAEMDAHLFCP